MIVSTTALAVPGDFGANTRDDPLAADAAKADQRFAKLMAETQDAKDTLAEITGGGAVSYWNWKIKEMRKQITDQVMQEMNLTAEKIAQMDAKQRIETENKITDMVEQRLRLAMAEEQKRKQHAVLDTSNSALSMLVAAQGVA